MAEEKNKCMKIKNPYKEGFNILMEYWDYLPEDDKNEIHDKLEKVGV